ncbi:alpha/beta-hydrolase [Rozella allomycis CSF55]|uniref:Alpha/beta-hydrolase n=1 Tax=Rozella allomycis (strain CSF55) TaxID=988480 RepID=A0A075AW77_ROZAC|nr:hypothetical protein O9G_005294 [Rozella allomycis CSF55]RKP19264.1 alpha/beta-hydrolase [Rozella allomycis CSF55]|eukprot:EPZ32962.1 hypothetical protein O9G_005294 [Rozella allomycis CSF55]
MSSKGTRIANNFNSPLSNIQVGKSRFKAPRYPVVLCHVQVSSATKNLESQIFQNSKLIIGGAYQLIKNALEALGVEVIVTSVPPCSTIEERAKCLEKQLREVLKFRDFSLVGHSMGGLDCRFVISHLSRQLNVRSLTTISTPHRGSSFMDWCYENVDRNLVESTLRGLAIDVRGFQNLTTKFCKDVFNPQTQDNKNVLYFSYGASPSKFNQLSVLALSHKIIKLREGSNDGMVSIKSSEWGQYLGTLDAEHFCLRKQNKYFDVKNLYSTIVDHLNKQGF